MEPERTSDNPYDRRAYRINGRRDAALRTAWCWIAAPLIVALALFTAWNERQRANVATARAMAATAPQAGNIPLTLTLAKWEPVMMITNIPPVPDVQGGWLGQVTIRVKVSDTRHKVYACAAPIEMDGPIADYKFTVDGGVVP